MAGRTIAPLAFLILTCPAFVAADTERPFPGSPASSVSEQFLVALRELDANAIHSLLADPLRSQLDVAAVDEFLGQVRPLGSLEDTLLASSEPFDPDCIRQIRAASFARGEAQVITVACPAAGGWRLAGFHVTPGLRALLINAFEDVLPSQLGFGFIHHDCDLEPEPAEGQVFSCRATAADGMVIDFDVRRQPGGRFHFIRSEPISAAMSAPSDDLLADTAEAIIALYSARRYGEIHQQASAALKAQVGPERLAAMLELLHASTGPITDFSVSRRENDQQGLPSLTLAVAFEDGSDGQVTMGFLPERDRWRLSALAFDPPTGFLPDPQPLMTLIEHIASELTADPATNVECPIEDLNRRDGVECEGTAFGRQVPVRVMVDPQDPMSRKVFVDDLQTMLRARLERHEAMLGWAVDGLTCDETAPGFPGIMHCTVASPASDRRLTLVRQRDGASVIDIEKR